MTELSNTKPAHTLLITEKLKAKSGELMKVTFMDLIIRNVLEIKTVIQQSHRNEAPREYKFVVRGSAFKKYKASPFEDFFLSPYRTSPNLKMLIPNAIKVGFENAVSGTRLKKVIIHSLSDESLIRQNLIQKWTGTFSLTPFCEAKKSNLRSELSYLQAHFPIWLSHDKEKALQCIHSIGGVIYLLRGINLERINELDDDILMEFNRQNSLFFTTQPEVSGCSGCGNWDSGFPGGGDSGCSGDGCGGSGCSGCGGCGGGD